jgi:methylase of polypeptide subunit release factors
MQRADVIAASPDVWRCTVRFSTLQDELFMHSAYPTTAADAVFFGPDTYRFAGALTRHLAERRSEVRRAVDIGCGAGPGAVVIALRQPTAEVLATDINPEALRFAAVNASLAAAANVACLESNLLAAVSGRFDLITANPPYLIDSGQRAYRHGSGRLGEGLSLAIASLADERLAPGGTLLLYTGSAIIGGVDFLRDAVAQRLAGTALDWRYEELDPDVFGEELLEPAYAEADRIAAVLLTVTKSA